MIPSDLIITRRHVLLLLFALVTVDVVLVAINLYGAPSFLNFDEEKNFTTWLSSAKLLTTALAALWCAATAPPHLRRGVQGLVWPAVAALFLALSMDETATAHERLAGFLMQSSVGDSLRTRILGGDAAKDSFIWPLLFAPIIVALLYFLGSVFYTRVRGQRTFVLGLLGCVAFAAAVVLEGPAVYQSAPIEAWGAIEVARYKLFSVFEESAEVAGATLMLASLLLHATLARDNANPLAVPDDNADA